MVSANFHKRRNIVKKILISALVVAGLTFTGTASAKKLKFQFPFEYNPMISGYSKNAK